MKRIIAEIDNISRYIEDIVEPWAFNVVWRLDRVAQQLEELQKPTEVNSNLPKVGKKILNQYLEKMSFITENNSKLTQLIKQQNSRKATDIYVALKKHFGKLNRNESIEFIKNTLQDL